MFKFEDLSKISTKRLLTFYRKHKKYNESFANSEESYWLPKFKEKTHAETMQIIKETLDKREHIG